jgi:hypothetical protein
MDQVMKDDHGSVVRSIHDLGTVPSSFSSYHRI